jgi:hypothetical protein
MMAVQHPGCRRSQLSVLSPVTVAPLVSQNFPPREPDERVALLRDDLVVSRAISEIDTPFDLRSRRISAQSS